MKLKLDENIAASVAPRLAVLGLDVDTVLAERLGGRSDAEVWAAAQAEGRFLITQDLDFSDARRFRPGSHAGVLIVRLPDSEQWWVGDHWSLGFLLLMRDRGPDVLLLPPCTKCGCFVRVDSARREGHGLRQ